MVFSLMIKTTDNKEDDSNMAKDRYDAVCFSIAKKEMDICIVKAIIMTAGIKRNSFMSISIVLPIVFLLF